MAEATVSSAGNITLQVAARLIMVTDDRVLALVKQGYIPKTGRGQYTIVGVVQGYIRFLKDGEKRSAKSAAANRVAAARAAEIELRTAERAHRLIATDEAIDFVDEIVGSLKAELSGLAARLTRDVALRRKIKAEVDGVLQRAADRCEQRSSDLRTSGSIATADSEEEPR